MNIRVRAPMHSWDRAVIIRTKKTESGRYYTSHRVMRKAWGKLCKCNNSDCPILLDIENGKASIITWDKKLWGGKAYFYISELSAKLDELLESELAKENTTVGIEIRSYLKDALIIIKLVEDNTYHCLKLISMAERMIDNERARRQMLK